MDGQLQQIRQQQASLQPQQPQQLARNDESECDERAFRKSMLVPIKQMPFIGLFDDIRGQTKFEASGTTVANGFFWVVFDNLHALGKVDEHFEFRDPHNLLIGSLEEDSQFEGLTYVESTGHFIAIEEVYDHEEHGLVPVAHELKLSEDGTKYKTVQKCPVHFQLSHGNKGIEGLHYHEDAHGHHYLMALCEGNYCAGGRRGRDPGNGRLVIAEFNNQHGDGCGYNPVKVVDIPRTAFFTDYSGLAIRGNKIAIVSQENATLWLGTFDMEALEFTSEGTVYNFPRDNHCDIIWCNVEGVQWLDDARFVITTDKAKRYQPYRCMAHEMQLAIFALPDTSGHE